LQSVKGQYSNITISIKKEKRKKEREKRGKKASKKERTKQRKKGRRLSFRFFIIKNVIGFAQIYHTDIIVSFNFFCNMSGNFWRT